jgi:hypothetical protein
MRRIARIALGMFGSDADVERMFNSYAQCEGTAQQLEVILSVHRIEKQRRNGLMSRVENDNPWNRLASLYVRDKWPDT